MLAFCQRLADEPFPVPSSPPKIVRVCEPQGWARGGGFGLGVVQGCQVYETGAVGGMPGPTRAPGSARVRSSPEHELLSCRRQPEAWSTVRGLRWRWPRARADGGMLYTDHPCTTSDRSVGAVAAHRRRRTPRTQMAEMREQLARTSPGATFLPLEAIGCCTLTMHDCTAPAPACAGMHQRWRWPVSYTHLTLPTILRV